MDNRPNDGYRSEDAASNDPNDAQARFNRATDALVDGVMRMVQRLLLRLEQVVGWLQRINWPRIPLSPFQWVIVLFVLFSLAYIWATPIFEAGDEIQQYGMVEALAEGGLGTLPELDPENPDAPWGVAAAQPPLYYAIGGALISAIERDDTAQYLERNPFAQVDDPGSFGNKNIVLRDTLTPTLQGTVLAVYVLRLFNLALAVVTLWAIYRIGRYIAPHRPVVGLIAVSLTAFNPMFLFITGAVSNLNLAMMLNSVIIYLALITLREGFVYARSLTIAILLGLAAVTHISAVPLLVLVLAGTAWRARRRSEWRDWALLAAPTVLAFFAFGVWWYVRNVSLYGEVFGTAIAAQIAGVNTAALTIGDIFLGFQDVRHSFWGLFGVANIQASALLYAFIDFAVFLSIFGVVFLILQLLSIQDFSYARRELVSVAFLSIGFLIALVLVLLWQVRSALLDGTSFFPYMALITPLIAAGFVEIIWWLLFLLSPPERNFVRAGEAVPEPILREGTVWPMRLLGVWAVLIPFFTIVPAYAPPMPLAEVPDSATQVYARYDDLVELVGYRATDRRYIPGEEVALSLYWRVLSQTEADQTLTVALIDAGGQVIGKLDTFPGAGRLRTSSWQPEAIYEDQYVLRLSNRVAERQPFRVHVRWIDPEEQAPLTPQNMQGDPLEAIVLDIGAVVPQQLPPSLAGFINLETEEAAQITFGDMIRLQEYQFDVGQLEVLLNWEALELDGRNYTAFVHVYNQDGRLVGQSDLRPLLPTEYWRLNERYLMTHRVGFLERLAPGEYFIEIGWYELLPDGGWRRLTLPLPDPSTLPDDVDAARIIPQDRYRLFNVMVDAEGSVYSPQLEQLDPTTTPEAPARAENTPEATNEATSTE